MRLWLLVLLALLLMRAVAGSERAHERACDCRRALCDQPSPCAQGHASDACAALHRWPVAAGGEVPTERGGALVAGGDRAKIAQCRDAAAARLGPVGVRRALGAVHGCRGGELPPTKPRLCIAAAQVAGARRPGELRRSPRKRVARRHAPPHAGARPE